MSDGDFDLLFLRDGGQAATTIAAELAAFFEGAQQTLDIAIYDCGLSGALADTVGGALRAAKARGVAVRVGYFSTAHTVPGVPAPSGSTRDFVQNLGVPGRPITGYGALMHHKYVVRDAATPSGAVWTGSTNWTSDAWEREENVILRIPCPQLALLYAADFEELWDSGRLEHSGAKDGGTVQTQYAGQPVRTQVWFSPGQGPDMSQAVADAIGSAQRRVVLATPVLTVSSVLTALRDARQRSTVAISGVVDATQMHQVRHQWSDDPRAAWKIAAFDELVSGAHLAGKHSQPFSPTSVHDFMHLKMMVIDDAVFVGSYNFSHSGEENAENVLRFDCAALAEVCVTFINGLISRYGTTTRA